MGTTHHRHAPVRNLLRRGCIPVDRVHQQRVFAERAEREQDEKDEAHRGPIA